jgi:hypothetical protein
MPFIVERYGPLERLRLGAKPGVTGIWQLSPDRHTEIHENIEYDLYYLRHQSLLLDALIILETAFFAAGAVLHSLFPRLANAGRTREGPTIAVPNPGPTNPSLRSALDDGRAATEAPSSLAGAGWPGDASGQAHTPPLGGTPGSVLHHDDISKGRIA